MSFVRSLLLLLMALLPAICFAQTANQYFGYYYNDAASYNSSVRGFSENYNRINLYHIATWSGNTTDAGRQATEGYLLSQLQLARANGVKAIITVTSLVFQYNSGQWQAEPNASSVWNSFVNQMVSQGYIVPGNPQLSTVAAFYLVDEPDISGLADVNSAANPAIANAVAALRNNSSTSSIPIAFITTPNFGSVLHAISLVDWVGFDDYGASTSTWNSLYGQLISHLTAGQRTILVPKATNGGSACGVGGAATQYDSPWTFYSTLTSSSRVAWLAPFHWFSASATCPGVRDIPSLSTPYNEIGQTMKDATNPVIGEVDGVTLNSDGSSTIWGWTCTTGVPQSTNVDLYVGAPYGSGGVGIGRYLANQASEPAVATACHVASGSYRFTVNLSAATTAQYAGKKIYMYGIATYNGNNNQIGNSGNLAIP